MRRCIEINFKKIWLTDQYTNDDDKMICQMCENELPFKLNDGSYYFEKVQIDDSIEKEYHELYLALCPLCDAKYKVLVKKDSEKMDDFISSFQQDWEDNCVLLDLGINDMHSIYFTEVHFDDIQTILTELDK